MGCVRVSIGCDHGGFEQKAQLAAWLAERGICVEDRGCNGTESVDYPDYALPVADDVVAGRADFGILVCGTGIGMAIAANKVKGGRAANITNADFARLTRQHNNANVLTLSGRFVSLEDNKAIVEAFLGTPFEGGRHCNRLDKISAIEER